MPVEVHTKFTIVEFFNEIMDMGNNYQWIIKPWGKKNCHKTM